MKKGKSRACRQFLLCLTSPFPVFFSGPLCFLFGKYQILLWLDLTRSFALLLKSRHMFFLLSYVVALFLFSCHCFFRHQSFYPWGFPSHEWSYACSYAPTPSLASVRIPL